MALAAAGCGQGGDPAPAPPAAASRARVEGYMAPPELTGAVRIGQGLTLRGRAAPGAEVRLASPDGRVLTAAAAADGAWSMTLPPLTEPALFALSARVGERVVRGEGAVVALPQPGPPALLARAGFPALVLGTAAAGPVIAALDYDAGGGAGVAGLAPPQAQIRVSVDGSPAGFGQADAQGRFAVLASNQPLAPGTRRLAVEADAGRAEVQVAVAPPPPLGQAAYRAIRQDGGWRIDWSPAGGGVQTTVVFDRAPEAGS